MRRTAPPLAFPCPGPPSKPVHPRVMNSIAYFAAFVKRRAPRRLCRGVRPAGNGAAAMGAAGCKRLPYARIYGILKNKGMRTRSRSRLRRRAEGGRGKTFRGQNVKDEELQCGYPGKVPHNPGDKVIYLAYGDFHAARKRLKFLSYYGILCSENAFFGVRNESLENLRA